MLQRLLSCSTGLYSTYMIYWLWTEIMYDLVTAKIKGCISYCNFRYCTVMRGQQRGKFVRRIWENFHPLFLMTRKQKMLIMAIEATLEETCRVAEITKLIGWKSHCVLLLSKYLMEAIYA